MAKLIYAIAVLGLLAGCSSEPEANPDKIVMPTAEPIEAEKQSGDKQPEEKRKPEHFKRLMKDTGADQVHDLGDLRKKMGM